MRKNIVERTTETLKEASRITSLLLQSYEYNMRTIVTRYDPLLLKTYSSCVIYSSSDTTAPREDENGYSRSIRGIYDIFEAKSKRRSKLRSLAGITYSPRLIN